MNKNVQARILLLVACVLVVSFSYHFSLLDSWQEKILDRFFIKEAPSKDVVIVAVDDKSLAELGQWPWPRALFAQVLQRFDQARVVGFDINFSESSRLGFSDDKALRDALASSRARIVMPREIDSSYKTIVKPLDIFTNYVDTGFVNVESDKDGIVRFQKGLATNPSFASALTHMIEDGDFRINYKGPEKTFVTIPFVDVVEGVVPSGYFTDKIVIIGATAPNLQDFVLTPFGRIPGVEFHANVVNTHFEGGTVFRDLSSVTTYFLFIVCAGVAILLGTYFTRIISIVFLYILGFISIFILSSIAFSNKLILPVLYMEIAFIVGAILILVFQYAFESKEKRFIRKMFQYYLTPDVVEDLLKDPSKASLGGEEREMTVLFSDIRGFTTISEKLKPQELTMLLNEYLTAMTDIIMEEGGVVDKYIGDAIMAFWGAPLVRDDQAYQACKASLRMVEKLKELNQGWIKRGLPELHIGIGLNKGKMVVGNMGSLKRFNYTVMGDEVNFASRLEGITKQYGVSCLVSESVMKAVSSDDIIFRDLDLVLVKGKKEPRRIFDIVEDGNMLGEWNKGRELYAKGSFKEAKDVLEKIQKKYPKDIPTELYIKRCEDYIKNSPVDWKGVHEFKDK